jgi:hypothetical protein
MMLTFGLQVSRGSAGWASIITMKRSFVGGRAGEIFKGEVWPILRRRDNALIDFFSVGRSR